MKKCALILLFVTLNSAMAASSFQPYVGRYRIVKIVEAPRKCFQALPDPTCLVLGERIQIDSTEQKARLSSRTFQINMTEYSSEGEGRFSTATFDSFPGGAKWWSASHSANGASVKLSKHLPGYFQIDVTPKARPFDFDEFTYIVVRE